MESFEKRCLELSIKSDSELLDLHYAMSCVVNKPLRSTIIAAIMLKEYSNDILYSFCKPDELNLNLNLTDTCDLPWLHSDEMSSISHQFLSSAGIKLFSCSYLQLRDLPLAKISMNYH